MSENSCILVKEIDCDHVVLVEEIKTAVIVQPDTDVVIVACEQGPAGQDGQDGFGILQIDTGPVAPAATQVADSVAVATFRSVKWLVTLKDSVGGLFKFYEVIAIHDDTTSKHSVYGLIGDTISVVNNVDILAGFIRLNITNNSANTLDISVMRITTTV